MQSPNVRTYRRFNMKSIFLKMLVVLFLLTLTVCCKNPINDEELAESSEIESTENRGLFSSRRGRGYALIVGLKSVDPSKYWGWDGVDGCWGCELDVDNMSKMLGSIEYRITSLKTQAATRDRILYELDRASHIMRKNDIFVFYYSGHGGQEHDTNGDEIDGKDETFYAYDGLIIDDEIFTKLSQFRSGVRIVMLSDSCSSATNDKAARSIADPLLNDRGDLKASLIHFGGCKDDGISQGMSNGGAFTLSVIKSWNNKRPGEGYRNFYNSIRKNILFSQQPQYHESGNVDSKFRDAIPFTIDNKRYWRRIFKRRRKRGKWFC